MRVIKIGELVYMPRRRIKGMGVVLKIERPDAETISELLEVINLSSSWAERANKEKVIIENAIDKEFISSVLEHCTDQSAESFRRAFAKVHWFASPSYYTMDRLPHGAKWMPIAWLKNLRDR
jgi:hypothetical protein